MIERHVRSQQQGSRLLVPCSVSIRIRSGSDKGFGVHDWVGAENAHAGNADVQARLYATYQREYENFTHLPGESIDALF
jgi:urease beta subunit